MTTAELKAQCLERMKQALRHAPDDERLDILQLTEEQLNEAEAKGGVAALEAMVAKCDFDAYETHYPAPAIDRMPQTVTVASTREGIFSAWRKGRFKTRWTPGYVLLGGLLILLVVVAYFTFLPWQHYQMDCDYHQGRETRSLFSCWIKEAGPSFALLAIPYFVAWAIGLAFRESTLYSFGVVSLVVASAVSHALSAHKMAVIYAFSQACPFEPTMAVARVGVFRLVLFTAFVQTVALAILTIAALVARRISPKRP